ncbi:MAG: hypothetical protein ABEJ40_05380 [Haloarculaceae archaeon]
MRRWSAREAQTEPLAALAAVAVVGLALATYAGAFEASVPDPVDRNRAQPAADRVERALTVGGIVRVDRLPDAAAAGPEGYRTNVALVVGDRRHAAGPVPPATADEAARRVSVRTAPDVVAPARLVVHVWT